jgi:hypothetical protein
MVSEAPRYNHNVGRCPAGMTASMMRPPVICPPRTAVEAGAAAWLSATTPSVQFVTACDESRLADLRTC